MATGSVNVGGKQEKKIPQFLLHRSENNRHGWTSYGKLRPRPVGGGLGKAGGDVRKGLRDRETLRVGGGGRDILSRDVEMVT